ncbi:hypothetical protein [Streptomyces thermolilacinus]|uniref:Uncharacterized protein n=1 Tax=Streptomyces thermolilacinus SPC6 TaxID=1306406 RepID=A0A1D3DPL9_9ACTN|nr:hypothetical protein [Streptomyces thermolilacinus]OEJ94267.1 hypothetical protein J116_007090 [Streptomyces thermolilacinus SPC6]
MAEPRPAPRPDYRITRTYALHDDAWHIELHHRDAGFLVTAAIPDEDPAREPSFHLFAPDGHDVPYEVMLWFMAEAADEVRVLRAWTELPPAAVDTVVALREVVHHGWDDADGPALLALLSGVLPADQAAAVVREVLSAGPDALAGPPPAQAAVAALRERMKEAGWRSGTTDG